MTKDVCLGRTVYRGSAPAEVIVAASWIDFHDTDNNPVGYQRPFDQKRSQAAANYADTVADAFWPECILSIRDDGTEEDEDENVESEFQPVDGTQGQFGVLRVTYKNDGTIQIAGRSEPWRRAFSQVDCQHRLGSMLTSDKPVTFCIFPHITRRDEAEVFRTINAKQKGISTSLVDAIIKVTDPDAPWHLKWAWDLDKDLGSPYYKRVDTGGRGRDAASQLVRLAGLRQALRGLVPLRLLDEIDYDFGYQFVRAFWTVARQLWPKEFEDKTTFKLQTSAGQRGLAQFGQYIAKRLFPEQDARVATVAKFFPGGAKAMNWRSDGPLETATGKGGQRQVFEALRKAYGVPN